jgi:hypothetical protein
VYTLPHEDCTAPAAPCNDGGVPPCPPRALCATHDNSTADEGRHEMMPRLRPVRHPDIFPLHGVAQKLAAHHPLPRIPFVRHAPGALEIVDATALD